MYILSIVKNPSSSVLHFFLLLIFTILFCNIDKTTTAKPLTDVTQTDNNIFTKSTDATISDLTNLTKTTNDADLVNIETQTVPIEKQITTPSPPPIDAQKGYRYNNGTDDLPKTTHSGSTTRKLTGNETDSDITTESIFTLPPGITIENLTSQKTERTNGTEATTPIVPLQNVTSAPTLHEHGNHTNAMESTTSIIPSAKNTASVPIHHDHKLPGNHTETTTHSHKMSVNHTKATTLKMHDDHPATTTNQHQTHDDHTEATTHHHKMHNNHTDATQSTAATINVGTSVVHRNETGSTGNHTTVVPKLTTMLDTKPMPTPPVEKVTTVRAVTVPSVTEKNTTTVVSVNHTMDDKKRTTVGGATGVDHTATTPMPVTPHSNLTTQLPSKNQTDADTTRMVLDGNNTNVFYETTTNGKTVEDNSKRPTTRIDTSLETGNDYTTKDHVGTEKPTTITGQAHANRTMVNDGLNVTKLTTRMFTTPRPIETVTVPLIIVKCNKSEDCPTDKKCVDQRCLTICDEHSSNVNCTQGINPNFH